MDFRNNTFIILFADTEYYFRFTGILYKKSSDFYTGYIQVMVAEVNGYVLEIYVESDTQEELNTVLEMFN